jgi:hypothetical protein
MQSLMQSLPKGLRGGEAVYYLKLRDFVDVIIVLFVVFL